MTDDYRPPYRTIDLEMQICSQLEMEASRLYKASGKPEAVMLDCFICTQVAAYQLIAIPVKREQP